LEQCLHIFAFLKKYDCSKIVFDDSVPVFDEEWFQQCDWEEFYLGVDEVIPPNMPKAWGKPLTMTCFVDANHAGCWVMRWSHISILVLLNKAPILWYSKRQNTIETSMFGSEFIEMKTAIEMIEGLWYKLRMMGIGVDGSTNVFCDNKSVVKNTMQPKSTLKKKHNAIAYHHVREAQVAGVVQIAHKDGESNLANVLTKSLKGPRLHELISYILY
jgi:hypothetical protein